MYFLLLRVPVIAVVSLLAVAPLMHGADPTDFATLSDPDPETRIEALREWQTTLDPRLPDVLLRMLTDEGNSIRRLAARGIGSRWWQIPKDRVPEFVRALRRNRKSEFEDEVNMVRRGIGLLERSYRGDMFSRSPRGGRWVIYERFGFPCLIDTRDSTEELLGWDIDDRGWVAGCWGNGPIAPSVKWASDGETAAIEMIMGRKWSDLWVWRHGAGLRKIGQTRMLEAIGVSEENYFGPGGFFVEVGDWDGSEIMFEVSYTTQSGDEMVDRSARLAYDASRNSLRVLSK